jgi:hypothetical protein
LVLPGRRRPVRGGSLAGWRELAGAARLPRFQGWWAVSSVDRGEGRPIGWLRQDLRL